MSREEIREQLEKVFKEVLGMEVRLSGSTTAQDVKGWDSLAHVRIIMGTEKRFKVRLTAKEISGIKNIDDLVTLIESKT